MQSPVRLVAMLFVLLCAVPAITLASSSVHTSYLWHMHQPIYWPDESMWNPGRYERAYETISLGHSQNSVSTIFDKDDRVGDYQHYPKDAILSLLDLPDAGAQISFAGALMENLFSLGNSGWNGGRYSPAWYADYRTARSWTTSAGKPRLEPLVVGFHHGIAPLMDDNAFRMELACAQAIYDDAWGDTLRSKGFFPAEMCFSERLIPALVDAGLEWSIVGDLHVARACADYPYNANQDNCDPPNRADQTNPSQGTYTNHSISRGVNLKIPYPFGFTPHRAEFIDPSTGAVSTITVVPAANAMGWEEGYGLFGTGGIDAMAASNDPSRPMLVLFAHDGDNAWSGGYSYYYENVSQFSHAAAAQGYSPTTVATYLADHPVPAGDVVHVEDGGWVNAEGDFGSPQFINWNWPLVGQAGGFDIPGGWAEDERNWAVLTAAQNRVETAAGITGAIDPAHVVDPLLPGTTSAERAWHFLLAGYESGYMYYGASLDMEIKATLAANHACEAADQVIAGGADNTAPTIWLPQRLPWNPGDYGGGALWGYPGGAGLPHDSTFHVWTFAYDVSGLARVELMIREDLDGVNSTAGNQNETYAGGGDVGPWQMVPMTHRSFPKDEPWPMAEIDFTELPDYIADQYWSFITGYSNRLLDYYIEAEDSTGLIKRSPIQHVWVGEGNGGTTSPDSIAWWVPESPVADESVTIYYDTTARPLPAGLTPWIHYGTNGWQGTADAPMTWDILEEAHRYTIHLPSSATSLEFVFHDNAGTWDNNGGADWIVPVSGAAPSPFVMDGQLDASATVLATGGGLTLWGALNGEILYVATEGTSHTAALDRFLFLTDDTTTSRGAPWSKTGSVISWDYFLAAEESNLWSGWFDGMGAVTTQAGLDQAHGTTLEGTIDLGTIFARPLPDRVYLAASGYGTADAGVLAALAPAGNGDAQITSGEYFIYELLATSTPSDSPPAITPRMTLSPLPFNPEVSIQLLGLTGDEKSVEVFDLSGRLVRSIRIPSIASGFAHVHWDGDDQAGKPSASGLYLFRLQGGAETTVRKGLLIR